MHTFFSPRNVTIATGMCVAMSLFQSTLRAEQQFEIACPQATSVVPEPAVRKAIEQNERNLVKWVLAGYEPGLKGLLADAMSYVHENGQVSTKDEFFRDYLSKGYIDARLEPKEDMRQFGCTVTTVSRGYFRLKGEREYPTTAVTHIWAKTTEGDWVLVHRHESHKGPAIGPLLPQEGGVNNTDKAGAKPSLRVAKIISANESAWTRAMAENDAEVMEELMNDSLHYVHVTDHTSTKKDFMHELSTGFAETDFKGTTLRQFGNTVIALHNAHYWHTNEADQSRSQAMHCWVKFGDQWRIVSRHSARFLPY
jgi:ketosteroid isomerase-like protein